MIRFSAFADEIGPDLDEQLKTLASENVKFIELRGVWGKNVLDLTPDEVKRVKARMDGEGFQVSSIGSPIGKIRIDEDFDVHLDRFKHAVELAKTFGTRYIRLFSYYPPEGGDIRAHRAEVMRRMGEKVKVARGADVVCCHENEGRIYGEGPKECLELIREFDSPHLRNIFDPANYVVAGYHPFDDCWGLLKDVTEYFHIKDTVMSTKEMVPAGEGDGQIPEVLADAVKRGFDGFCTLEPHLKKAGQFSGETGPKLFIRAIRALKKVCDDIGADYDAK
ncbi:MAG TPA: sugar phosphate isomerase/epimerase family protein [Planctomycetota bacterium]|nr:sugar phosphate isomerase/epimerase family protein [Planctomycetota bacterium]